MDDRSAAYMHLLIQVRQLHILLPYKGLYVAHYTTPVEI